MKKLLALSAAILFVGALSLSVLAFTDGDPKKQKTESTCSENCEKHKGTTADGQTAAGTAEEKSGCCDKAKENASAGCEHHKEATADTK